MIFLINERDIGMKSNLINIERILSLHTITAVKRKVFLLAIAYLYLNSQQYFITYCINTKEVDTKIIARSFKKALAEIDAQEFNKLGSHFLKLVAYGNTNSYFQEFRNDRNDTRYANEQKKREELVADRMPEVEDTVSLPAAESRAEDDIRLSVAISILVFIRVSREFIS